MGMKDYCADPLCGWLLEVDKDGYCFRHSRADMLRGIQDAFGTDFIDVTEETRKIWKQKTQQVVAKQVPLMKARNRARLKIRLLYWFVVPAVLSIGVFYIFYWIGALLK